MSSHYVLRSLKVLSCHTTITDHNHADPFLTSASFYNPTHTIAGKYPVFFSKFIPDHTKSSRIDHMHTEKDDLVKAVARGDIKAFNQLFEEFYAPLFYYSFNLVQDKEEAKDIVLTALYKGWERREQFKQYQHIKSFLYLVVRNAGLNFLKKEQNTATHMQDLLQATELHTQEDDYLATEAEVLKKVFKAIDELPNKCREVFKLTYLENKSVQDIAAILQITPSNVSAQRHRALSLLRLALTESPIALLYLYIHIIGH